MQLVNYSSVGVIYLPRNDVTKWINLNMPNRHQTTSERSPAHAGRSSTSARQSGRFLMGRRLRGDFADAGLRGDGLNLRRGGLLLELRHSGCWYFQAFSSPVILGCLACTRLAVFGQVSRY